MNKKIMHALMLGAIGITSTSAFAATDVYLCAGSTAQMLPPATVGATLPVSVPMWGYAQDDDNNLANGCGNPVMVPGVQVTLPPGETNLVIHLRNDLPEATSIVLAGQAMPEDGAGANALMLAPHKVTTITDPRPRVRSFTAETAAGATGTYYFNNLRPGTYVYQTATHVAKQLQMGLFGALTLDVAAGEAYPGVNYDVDAVLFYSEIDPVMHTAIDGGTYGPGKAVTSTIDYHPTYFLVNGQPYDINNPPPPIVAGTTAETTLLRLINMGQETHIPVITNGRVNIVAEDGRVYHHPRNHYSVDLAAGKTKDALFNPTAAGSYAVYDGVFNMTNGVLPHGGMLAYLDVAQGVGGGVGGSGGGSGGGTGGGTGGGGVSVPGCGFSGANAAPIAVKDIIRRSNTGPSLINVLANDTDDGCAIDSTTVTVQLVTGRATRDAMLTTSRAGATVMVNPDNSILYTPAPGGFQGSDTFKYTVVDNNGTGLESNKALVRVNLR